MSVSIDHRGYKLWSCLNYVTYLLANIYIRFGINLWFSVSCFGVIFGDVSPSMFVQIIFISV